jgi:ketosteroid isomerase-like protein
MKPFVVRVSMSFILFAIAFHIAYTPAAAAADQASVLQADREFVQAAAKDDSVALAKFLDPDFTWTDAEGKTLSRADVLRALPKPALGDEAGAQQQRQSRSQVEAIMADRDKIHVLRLWVKRGAAWRLLVYHEVALGHQEPRSAGSGVTDCENPCKTVPYEPKNEAEKEIIASWQALETGVTHHDAATWAPHIADEFAMLSSSNDRPLTKADRIATLNAQKQAGRGSAPSPLVSAQMFDFGDSVIMTCLHQPFTGKPVRVSRLWIKRDGKWIMSISFQTTVQAAPAKTS